MVIRNFGWHQVNWRCKCKTEKIEEKNNENNATIGFDDVDEYIAVEKLKNQHIYLEQKDSPETVVTAAAIANQQRKTRLGHYCFCLLHSRLSPVCYSKRNKITLTYFNWILFFPLFFLSCDYYDRFSNKKILPATRFSTR